jgi:hypothetical protein
MIDTPIMLNEINKNITKLMGTLMNELIFVMKVIKLDISLTQRTWLDIRVPHMSMVTKKLMEHITNSIKSYLMLR